MNGHRIQAARRRKHLTQQQVADALHCDRSYISKIESNAVEPSDDFYQSLCFYLGIAGDEARGLTIDDIDRESATNFAKAKRLLRVGRISDAQVILETLWSQLPPWGEHPRTNALVRLWAETLGTHPETENLGTIFLGQMLVTAARHEWTDLFQVGITFQRTLVQRHELPWADWLTRALLELEPPPRERFRLDVGLGTVHLRMSRTEEAMEHFQRGIALWQPELGTRNLGRCYHGIGAGALALEDLDRAENQTREACEIYREVDAPLYHLALQNLGIGHALRHQWSVAERELSAALDFWQQQHDTEHMTDVTDTMRTYLS